MHLKAFEAVALSNFLHLLAFGLATARLAGRDVLFGVTIDPRKIHGTTARQFRRHWDIGVFSLCALYAAVFFIGHASGSVGSQIVALMVVISGLILLFMVLHRQALPYHAAGRLTSHELPPEPYAKNLPLMLEALPAALICGSLITTAWMYDSDLSQRLPTRFDWYGAPIEWAEKTGWTMFRPLLEASLFYAWMTALGVFLSTRLRLGYVNPRTWQLRRRYLIALVWIVYLLKTTWVFRMIFQQLVVLSIGKGLATALGPLHPLLDVTMLVGVLLGSLSLSRTVRLTRDALDLQADSAALAPTIVRTARRRFFQAYRNEPAVFIERRLGVLPSGNWGNPRLWLLLIVMAAWLIVMVSQA